MEKTEINWQNKTILITGAAGFIGANLAESLLQTEEADVIGIDSLNAYYDVSLKEYRLERLRKYPRFTFIKGNIADKGKLMECFQRYQPEVVVHLAAQAGVRYSIIDPDAYIEANIVGFYNVLECCRNFPVQHLVYASSSSIYGANSKIPYSVGDRADQPVSLYAATKKADELIAHSYSKLYGIPMTGLRFFTVYGPAGRPDMAYFSFTDKLRRGEDIEIFNYGKCKRDFTYIDDIVRGIVLVMGKAPARASGGDGLPAPPYAIYNIGNSHPEDLLHFIQVLHQELKRSGLLPDHYELEPHMKLVPMQPGDVAVTYADITDLETDFGYRPSTPIEEGLRRFTEWYAGYYQ